MSQGLQFKNLDGDVLIDSDYHHYHFVGIAEYIESIRIPKLIGGTLTTHSYSGSTDLSSTQVNGDIYKYRIVSTSSTVPPVTFIRPSFVGTSAPFCGVILTQYISGGTWEIWVLQDHGFTRPSLYCFNRFDRMTTEQSSVPVGVDYGITTYNSVGSKTYDSRLKPLKVVGTSTTTAPSIARSSVVSSYDPNFTPDQINTINITTTSGNTSDYMFYAPSMAHSCQSVTRTADGEGFQSAYLKSYFYAWARADLWWCFYRNTFRVLSDGQIQSAYSIYASGHVWKSVEEENGIIGTLLGIALAPFTFGASIGVTVGALALGAIAISAFTTVGAVQGVYLPYENDSRNSGQSQPFVVSRASYYGYESGVIFVDTDQTGGADSYQLTYEYSTTAGSEYYVNYYTQGFDGKQTYPQARIRYNGALIYEGEPPTLLVDYFGEYVVIGGYRYYLGPHQYSGTITEGDFYSVGRRVDE